MSAHISSDLTGKFLIALPAIGDGRFARAVILVCAHTPEFAMGLILNKPLIHVKLPRLFDQLNICGDGVLPERTVLDGGPVGADRGFVVHTDDVRDERSTLDVAPGLCMTATRSLLVAIASAAPPQRFQVALGYSGWSGGQLEQELADNAWLVSELDTEIIFSDQPGGKWRAALGRIGVDLSRLQIESGNA